MSQIDAITLERKRISLRLFLSFCVVHIFSRFTKKKFFRCATVKKVARENSVISYFTRLSAISGRLTGKGPLKGRE